MKKQLLLLLLMLFHFTGFAQVQIGSNVNNASRNLPFRLLSSYSYNQAIYLASEINAPAGTITSIQWYYNGALPLSFSQDLEIYIGNTTKSEFATNIDFEPVANLKKVYTGKFPTGSVAGWKTIILTDAFIYDGSSNLVVAVDENTYDSEPAEGAGMGFYTTEVPTIRSLTNYGSGSKNIDPANPTGFKLSSKFVANIIFGGITQSCTTPVNITFSDITDTKATVSWNDIASHTEGSQFYLSTTNTPPTASTPATGSATTIKSIEITDLDPITTYYVWVRNQCGTGSYSAWSEMTTFFSGCAIYDTFEENFDSTANSNMPFCWSKILRSDGTISNAQVRAINSNAYSLPNAMVIGNGATTGTYDVIAVSPEMSNLGTGLYRLKFYAKYAGVNITSGSIEIGTLDNNTESGFFKPIQGVIVNVSSDYVEYTVPLDYIGTNKYVGIRHASATAGTLIYIDDIRYEIAPNCPDVSNVAVTAVSSNGLTVTWKEAGVEGKWDIVVGDDTVTDPNTLVDFDTTNDVSHSFTKTTGLTAGTDYKVWVRSHCPNGDRGAWIGEVAFATLCESAEVIIEENFDMTAVTELPTCWSKLLRGASTSARVETVANAASASGPNSVRLFSANSSGNYEIILVSAPLLNLGEGTHRLRFTVSGIADPQLQIGTLNSNLNSAVFTPLALQSPLDVTSEKVEHIIDFSSYSGGTDMFIGFKLVSPNDYKTIYLDDISWEKNPTCADVKNVVVSGVSATAAGFTWDVQGTEHLWDVAVAPASTIDTSNLNFVTTDYDVNAIEVPVEPSTAYKVWVRSHCESENGAWIGPVQFNSDCNSVTTFNEDFNAYAFSLNLPACWNKIIKNAKPDASLSVSKNGIEVYGANSNSLADVILVCPIVSNLKDPNYKLNLKAGGNVTVEVGTVNNLLPNAAFTYVTDFTPSDFTSKVFSLDLSTYTGDDQYIALRMKTQDAASSQYFVVDDISWTATLGTNDFDFSKITYYPNPVKDVLNVSYDNTITSVSVYNVIGQNVLTSTVNTTNAAVNLSALNAGTYFVKVTVGDQIKTIKILKD